MFSNTKVFIDVYKGKKIFAVWKVDQHGNKEGKYPLISFGAKKAQAIIPHLPELNDFIAKYGEEETQSSDDAQTVTTDLKNLF